MPRLRLLNGQFEWGFLFPWEAVDVEISRNEACNGRFSARFPGQAQGVLQQLSLARGNRCYTLVFQAGATGPDPAPLLARVAFLNQQGEEIGAAEQTIPAASLPNVAAATPQPCACFCLEADRSPAATRRVLVQFAKLGTGGADILVDSVALVEF